MKRFVPFIVLFLIFGFTLHKIHLSNTTIVYKPTNTVEITIRCFVTDIESTVEKLNNITLELGNERELKDADTYLKEYLLDNFKMEINKKQVNINYLGKEVEKDIIFFYLEITDVSKISKITIENTILLKIFDDQQNIIRLEINGKRKSMVLKNNDFIGKAKF